MSAWLPRPPGHPGACCSAPPCSGQRRNGRARDRGYSVRHWSQFRVSLTGHAIREMSPEEVPAGNCLHQVCAGRSGTPCAGPQRASRFFVMLCLSRVRLPGHRGPRRPGGGTRSRRGMAATRRGRDVRAGVRRAGGPPEAFPENDLLVVQVPQGMKRAAQGAPHRRAGLDPAQVLAGRHHDRLDMRVACTSGHVSLIARRRGTAVCR